MSDIPSIDSKELLAARRELDRKILDLLQEFERRTGLVFDSVNYVLSDYVGARLWLAAVQTRWRLPETL